jgi:hypothetical protein
MTSNEFRTNRGVAAAVLAVCLGSMGAVGAACDSGDGSSASSDQKSRSGTPTAAPPVTPVDACMLVSRDRIATLLGTGVDGQPQGDPTSPGCIWENPQTFESVSVTIGKEGTAVNDTLPPPDPASPDATTPGPDGMRFLGNGSVEFAAGGRSNTVQVAVLNMKGDQSNDAAVDLARKISSQLDK